MNYTIGYIFLKAPQVLRFYPVHGPHLLSRATQSSTQRLLEVYFVDFAVVLSLVLAACRYNSFRRPGWPQHDYLAPHGLITRSYSFVTDIVTVGTSLAGDEQCYSYPYERASPTAFKSVRVMLIPNCSSQNKIVRKMLTEIYLKQKTILRAFQSYFSKFFKLFVFNIRSVIFSSYQTANGEGRAISPTVLTCTTLASCARLTCNLLYYKLVMKPLPPMFYTIYI